MTKDTITAAQIQGWLDKGPRVPIGYGDKPLFKLVWSDDERELRIGTYRTYQGDSFVREETKTERVLKYSFIRQRWIVEQWFPPEVCLNPELPESTFGSYEPIYVFDKEGRFLPLNLSVVQFLVQTCLKPKTSEMYKKSLSKTTREEIEKKATEADFDCLNDEGPLVSQFHDGSAIIMPGIEHK